MVSYKCPNCGRVYNYGEEMEFGQCKNCGYGLKKVEDVKKVAHPELNPMLNNKHVIGYTSNSGNKPKCPTCQSTNVSKISGVKRWLTTGLFGLASSDIGKTMKCNNCGYKW